MRISDWAKSFNIRVERAPVAPGTPVYRVKDIFTTRDGSWEPSSVPGSIPQWARDAYLTKDFDDAGGATHLFGAMMRDGWIVPGGTIEYWTHTDNQNRVFIKAKNHGWANLFMSPDASFVPDRGEIGPWAWCPAWSNTDTVIGGGLPQRWHISTFVVWELVNEPVVVPPPPPSGALEQRVFVLEQSVGSLSAEVKMLKKLMGQWVGE